MNAFQQSSIFAIRLVGVLMLVIAVMGLLHYGYKLVVGSLDPVEQDRFVAGVLWLVFGLGFIIVSRPLGAWLGHDLG